LTELILVGVPKEAQIYTLSMNFRKIKRPVFGHELATGYLDDLLILSFGYEDETSHMIEVGVEDVLHGHYLCQDLMGPSF
jgi:hypothetical protein